MRQIGIREIAATAGAIAILSALAGTAQLFHRLRFEARSFN
jgi:hypothetical protein